LTFTPNCHSHTPFAFVLPLFFHIACLGVTFSVSASPF
jgi:hypothetical protein